MYAIIQTCNGTLSIINVILSDRIFQLPELMDFLKKCVGSYISILIRAKEKSQKKKSDKKHTKDIRNYLLCEVSNLSNSLYFVLLFCTYFNLLPASIIFFPPGIATDTLRNSVHVC